MLFIKQIQNNKTVQKPFCDRFPKISKYFPFISDQIVVFKKLSKNTVTVQKFVHTHL